MKSASHLCRLCSGLIVYRIWDLHHQITGSAVFKSPRVGGDRVKTVVRVFIESALLYTVVVAISAIAELAKTNAYYSTIDTVGELSHGIRFSTQIRWNRA